MHHHALHISALATVSLLALSAGAMSAQTTTGTPLTYPAAARHELEYNELDYSLLRLWIS